MMMAIRTYQRTTIFDVADITQAIVNSTSTIEDVLGHTILFGAVGGSYSMRLQNSSSDIDCYLVIDGNPSSGVIQKQIMLSIQREQVPVDFMCVSYRAILDEIEAYIKRPKLYPTVLFRTEAEQEQNVKEKDILRPDFKRSMLFRILLSDHIINEAMARERHAEFTGGILIRDIIDYQFTRIYGNYSEAIDRQQLVSLRKYLYVIHEICTCEALMNFPQKPPMDFLYLMKRTLPGQHLKSKVALLYHKNRQRAGPKTQEMVPQDGELNNFIARAIERISNYLKTNMGNTEVLYFL